MRKSAHKNSNYVPDQTAATYSVLVKMAKAERALAINSSKLVKIAVPRPTKSRKPVGR